MSYDEIYLQSMVVVVVRTEVLAMIWWWDKSLYRILVMSLCSGYLYGHVSYLSEGCDACLLLLTVDREHFYALSQAKQKITEVNTA